MEGCVLSSRIAPYRKRRSQIKVQIHAIVIGTTRLGPGYRAGIWFQGCPFRCPGCIAPDTLETDAGIAMDVGEIIRAIAADSRIDGVTCSGGEPFAQPQALTTILRDLRNSQRGVIVFSGYKLEYLRQRGASEPAISDALGLVDVLIDGVYIQDRNSSDMQMRGSDNQRIHFLTDRYANDRSYFETYNRETFEIRPTISGETMLIGVPTRQASTLWTILGTTNEIEELQNERTKMHRRYDPSE